VRGVGEPPVHRGRRAGAAVLPLAERTQGREGPAVAAVDGGADAVHEGLGGDVDGVHRGPAPPAGAPAFGVGVVLPRRDRPRCRLVEGEGVHGGEHVPPLS
jgi:hypothetical protein